MSTIESAIGRVIQRKLNEVQGLFDEAESKLSALGLRLTVKVTQARSGGRKAKGKGAKGYWQAIKSLAQEEGIGIPEARKLYTGEKTGDKAPKAARRTNRKGKADGRSRNSRLKKQYWKEVKKIAADKNVSLDEARQLHKSSKAA